jgi:alpha-glucuronidase
VRVAARPPGTLRAPAGANWYAFGRFAWDHTLDAGQLADEWLRMTFTGDDRFVAPVRAMMLASREAVVD